jgi:high-affinity iron transporter
VRRGEALWREGTGQAQLRDLRALVLQSPADAEREGGDALAAVRAFLTTHPEALDASRPAGLVLARTRLREALSAYARGEFEQARQLAIAAHAEALVPLEERLEAADPALRREIVRELLALRFAIEAHRPASTVAAHATRIELLLDRAAGVLERGTRAAKAVYVSALLILLREGVESILVLATIVAVARKTGARAMRSVHAGWIAAVLLALATWFAAGRFIDMAGASREVTEGVSTLLAAAMLLYVGSWLHQRPHMEAWREFLRERIATAQGPRALWALAGVAFLALYRELFEIVLMVQALWAQAGPERQRAVIAGLASATLLLAGLGWFIVKYAARLPLARFHAATSALLVVMALVFVGDGVSALQEAGVLPATSVRFAAVPLLGIHPTAQGLGAQAVVAALIAAAIVLARRQRPR